MGRFLRTQHILSTTIGNPSKIARGEATCPDSKEAPAQLLLGLEQIETRRRGSLRARQVEMGSGAICARLGTIAAWGKSSRTSDDVVAGRVPQLRTNQKWARTLRLQAFQEFPCQVSICGGWILEETRGEIAHIGRIDDRLRYSAYFGYPRFRADRRRKFAPNEGI